MSRTLRRGRDATAQIETAHVHVLLVAHRDLKFVQIEERDGNGLEVIEKREELLLFVGLTRQFNSHFNAVFSAGCHGSPVLRRGSVKQMETNLIQACLAKILGSVWIERYGSVDVNVMFGSKSGLELHHSLQGLLQVEHRVASCDAGAGRFHGSAFLHHLLP